MKRFLIFCAIIFSLSNCNNLEVKETPPAAKVAANGNVSLLGSWRLADLEAFGSKSKDPLLETANDKKILQQGLIFSVFEDGTFTEIAGDGEYDFGKWNFVEGKKTIYLRSKKYNDTFKIKADHLNSKELLMMEQVGIQKITFSRSGNAVDNVEQDPYYPNNNNWRIKPKKSETDAQIKERFTNYLSHLAYILKTASDQKQPAVSFQFSQGIIEIYSGGIGIKNKEEVPAAWLNCYYSSKQAWQAYDLFANYLKTSRGYKGASTGEWYIDDYNILTSIYGDLKQNQLDSTTKSK